MGNSEGVIKVGISLSCNGRRRRGEYRDAWNGGRMRLAEEDMKNNGRGGSR